MKNKLPPFIAGMLATTLIGGLGVTALAATGQLTITVDPINIQVNGATFQPKDAQGADVPVFAYNGTTYAPLRALAEAYGLEVGYDAQTNMATVTGDVAAPIGTTTPAPDTTASVADYSDWTAEEEAAYQEFKGMWEVSLSYSKTDDPSPVGNGFIYVAIPKDLDNAKNYWESTTTEKLESLVSRLFYETTSEYLEEYACHLNFEYGVWGDPSYHKFANAIGGSNGIYILNIAEKSN